MLQSAKTSALLACLLTIAACHDDNGCSSCVAPTPAEVSMGLVAGNFNDNGHASLIATSTVIYYPQYNAGNLKIYLSTGPATFAAPVLLADGYDPLYLASADLNGDKLPDVV